MLGKFAASIIEKGARAKQKHDRSVTDRIARHAATYEDPASEEKRMQRVIDKLVKLYDLPEYQRVLIDGAAEEVLNFENDEKFQCPRKANVNSGFRRNLERYEGRLAEIEDAVDERLGLEDIGPNEGLVVILFYASGYAQNVHINRLGAIGGDIHFGPVENRDYFRVLKVKAGEYRWHSIWNKHWRGRTTLYVKHSNLDFTVEAGKLNYTGVFMFSNKVWRRWQAGMRDRTSVVVSLLEDRYPELLETMELSNGVNSDNRFIEFYFREKAAARAEDDGA